MKNTPLWEKVKILLEVYCPHIFYKKKQKLARLSETWIESE